MTAADVAIVGGGAMGWSTAFWLMRRDASLRVKVVERDPSHAQAATALSVASIRQQFTCRINVKISRFGIDFLQNFSAHTEGAAGVASLGLREQGYLFLAGSQAGAEVLRTAAAMQRDEGAATEVLAPDDLAARFPWLAVGDVALAAFGPRDEGWFDNMGLLAGLRGAAMAAGAEAWRGEVVAVTAGHDAVHGVRLADGTQIAAGAVVLAAGTGVTPLLAGLGEKSPVEPRKRTVFVIDAPGSRHPHAPLMVDHTGFYLRPEGDHWITATVPDDDGACAPGDFEPDLAQFEQLIWPRLYARAPGFAAVKVLRAWAGHYDFNRLDAKALAGLWPGWRNLYALTGFSGHGLQQAPAMGRGMAELVTGGRFETLDLSELAPERLHTGTRVLEKAVV